MHGKGRELVSYLLAANLQLTANGFIWRLVDNLRAIGLSVRQGGREKDNDRRIIGTRN